MVKVGKFKDETTIVGDRHIGGNLFTQASEAEEAIKNFINVRYEITGDELTRKSIWDYPLEAIREVLLNALVHRDYFKSNVQTQIKIFDDYIWFFNIGGLPSGITIEQLKDVHPSVARNPLIVHVFYLAGLIEEYGSGIGRILNSLDRTGLPEPEFKEEFDGFSIYMRKKRYTEEYLKELGLNERQIKAMAYVEEHGSISIGDYAKIVPDVDERTLQRDFSSLVEKNLLKIVGKTKGRRYELK